MASRSVLVGILSTVILLPLLFVLYIKLNTTPTPSISPSPTGRPIYPVWNGYSPLLRLFAPILNSNPNTKTNSGRISPKNILAWVVSLLSPRPQAPPTTRSVSLPHGFQTTNIAGISVVHHNPFSAHQLAGVVLLLHACRQSASDWFILPEHRRITAQLLRRNLAILAITSSDRITRCWSTRHPASHNYDAVRVRLAVRQWTVSQGIAHDAPFYAIGVSSGATFLSVLSSAYPPFIPSLSSQAFYLSVGNPRAIRNATGDSFPNTIFVHLHSDKYYAPSNAIAASRMTLLAKHVPLVADLPLFDEIWTPRSIHEHEPLVTEQESVAIFQHLPQCHQSLECAVKKAILTNSSIGRLWERNDLRQSLTQVERVLRGKHEFSASHAAHIVDWLLQNGRHVGRVDNGE